MLTKSNVLFYKNSYLSSFIAGHYGRFWAYSCMLSFFLSKDYLGFSNEVGATVKQSCKALFNIKSIKNFAETLNVLDDELDVLPPSKKLKFGKAELGSQLSEFLINFGKILPEYTTHVEKLISKNITSKDTIFSFGNIYADLIYKSSELELGYQNTKSSALRIDITSLNMQIASVSACHLVDLFKRSSRLEAKALNGVLTANDVSDCYPEVYLQMHLLEMCDDLIDFFTDFEEELDNHVVAPNWIITELYMNGGLVDGSDQESDLKNFIEQNRNNEKVISFEKYPESLKRAISSGFQKFKNISKNMSKVSSVPMKVFWDSAVKTGMRTSVNPKIVDKRKSEKVIQEYILSL